MLTFLRKGAVDYLAGLTSSFIFIVFTLVNSLALIYYFKKKTPEEKQLDEEIDKKIQFSRVSHGILLLD